MIRGLFRLTLTLALVALTSTAAFAQGGAAASSLSGVVVDSGGGVIPGATVAVKNNGTGTTINLTTNTAGVFTAPALGVGAYTVTVTLTGFKTAVISDVRIAANTPSELKIVLEVGALSETVEVRGGSQLIQTQSPTITSTLSVDQMNNLPLATRNALNFVTFLPGVETTGSNRGSTVNGLPQGTINITMDGVNIQDNHLKTGDGFFARVYPRQDAVEEVTVTTATQGADAAGQGAVQINFVTRSGTNRYDTSVYHYFRHPAFNTIYWFNERNGLDKNRVILHQYGGRLGGPIVVPGLFDGRGKAFFFVNHEEFWNPSEATRNQIIMHPITQTGVFRYNSGGQVREVNVWQIAAAARATGLNVTTTPDPTIAALLAQIRASTGCGADCIVTDMTEPNTQRFLFQNAGAQHDQQPTTKLDWNISPKHRLSGSYTWLHLLRDPDFLNGASPAFPNFPNYRTQDSYRVSGATWMRSTLTANLVNEIRLGGGWGPTWFGRNVVPSHFDNQGGYSVGFGFPNANNAGLSSATISNGPSARSARNWGIDNTLSWQKGPHNMNFGASFTQIRLWLENWSVVPSISIGVDNADPASGLFTTATIPGASNAQLDDAEDLYALLIGSVTQIGGTGRINERTGRYDYNGTLTNRARMDEWGFFAQDSWRFKPNVTFNFGVRWELQLPFQPLNGVMTTATFADLCGISGARADGNCNFFTPGAASGIRPQFVRYDPGQPGYKTDWNNFAPNIGVAWRPNAQDGFLRAILGDPDQATIRGGYSVAYNRNGTSDFTGVFGSNPGDTTGANRNVNNGNLLLPGESFPVLFRERGRLGPPPTCPEGTTSASCMTHSPIFPIVGTTADELNIFDPNLEVSFSRSYTIGLQRSITKDMAVEARYVGTRNVAGWTTENYNEINIQENGFFNEFKLAMANLQSHVAAGCGQTGNPACSFAYRGPGTGTSPLPIYLAHLTGTPLAQAGDASRYTGTSWTSNNFLSALNIRNPSPTTPAGTNNNSGLRGSTTRRNNALAAGVPANYFILNPDVGSANITKSESFTKYHSLQVDLRRRTSRGLYVNFNYTYARRWGSSFDGQHYGRVLLRSTGAPHAFKTNWTYEIPVGRGKRFGTDMNSWLEGVVGGWEFSGTGRFQSRLLNLGTVRLIGMTLDDLQKEYYIRFETGADGVRRVYMLPEDIRLNTRRAYSTSATSANGYSTTLGAPEGRYIAPANYPGCIQLRAGDCATRQNFMQAPWFSRFDVSFKKRFRLSALSRRAGAELTFDLLNVFDNVNFNPVLNPGSDADIFEVTSAYSDSSNTFDPGGRLGQIVWRITW